MVISEFGTAKFGQHLFAMEAQLRMAGAGSDFGWTLISPWDDVGIVSQAMIQ